MDWILYHIHDLILFKIRLSIHRYGMHICGLDWWFWFFVW